LHRVIDRQPRRHDAAGRIDIHRDFFFGVLSFEEQQLSDDQRRHAVFDRPGDENDSLLQEARKNIECSLAAIGLLDHHRHEIHVCPNRIAHRSTSQ